MPESELHVIDSIKSQDGRPEDASYTMRTEEQDIKRRLNTLFGDLGKDVEAAEQEEETVAA